MQVKSSGVPILLKVGNVISQEPKADEVVSKYSAVIASFNAFDIQVKPQVRPRKVRKAC